MNALRRFRSSSLSIGLLACPSSGAMPLVIDCTAWCKWLTNFSSPVMAANVPHQFDCALQSAAMSVFNNALLHREILTYLSVATLYRLSYTCRTHYDLVTDYMLHIFNINHQLRDYFTDPLSFRELQARTGMIISGSFALQFLHRVAYPNSDLDL